MKTLSGILLLFTLLFTSACLKQELKPQEPIWGKQTCATCRMILSEKRYAVQRVLSSGEILYYDDLNCALNHDHLTKGGTLYVRPYGGDNWVEAEKAMYSGGLMTPMNSGFGAQKIGGTINFTEIKKKFEGI